MKMRISDIIEAASAIIALLIGLLSMWQNNRQIKILNKQTLFDKRYKIWLLLQHMDNLCTNNLRLLNRNDSLMAVDFIAACLVNSVHFYQMYDGFVKGEDDDAQTKFLALADNLKDYGVQAKLLFPEKYASYISEYFNNYVDLLLAMKKYDRLLCNISNISDEMFKTNERKMEYQDSMLHGDLAKNIESDVNVYKKKLCDLHSEYEMNKKQLSEYLIYTEKN